MTIDADGNIIVHRVSQARRRELLNRTIESSGFSEAEIREQASRDELQNFHASFAWALISTEELTTEPGAE